MEWRGESLSRHKTRPRLYSSKAVEASRQFLKLQSNEVDSLFEGERREGYAARNWREKNDFRQSSELSNYYGNRADGSFGRHHIASPSRNLSGPRSAQDAFSSPHQHSFQDRHDELAGVGSTSQTSSNFGKRSSYNVRSTSQQFSLSGKNHESRNSFVSSSQRRHSNESHYSWHGEHSFPRSERGEGRQSYGRGGHHVSDHDSPQAYHKTKPMDSDWHMPPDTGHEHFVGEERGRGRERGRGSYGRGGHRASAGFDVPQEFHKEKPLGRDWYTPPDDGPQRTEHFLGKERGRGRGRGSYGRGGHRASAGYDTPHESHKKKPLGRDWYTPPDDGPQRTEHFLGRGRGRERGRGSYGRGGHRASAGFDSPHESHKEKPLRRDWYTPPDDGPQKTEHLSGRGRGRGGHHASGGRGGSHKEKPVDRDKSWFDSVKFMSLQDINSLSKLPPEILVNDLFDRIKAFQCTLQKNQSLDKPGAVHAIVKILSKVAGAMTSSDCSHKACQILGEALSDRCPQFRFHLKMYVLQELAIDNSRFRPSVQVNDKIRLVGGFFQDLLTSLPSSSWSCLPVDELKSVVEEQINNTSSRDVESLEDLIHTVVSLRDGAREQALKQVKRGNPEEANWDNSEYRSIQILPQWNEVCEAQKPPRLRKNIVSGGYQNWLHYYDIQFRLLREDFMAPLRNGVCDYLNGTRGRKLKNVRVYKNVLVREPVFRDSGICYNIKLDFSSMRRHCNWEHSKRLLFGSLLCLSPDNDHFTDEVYFATVTDRDPKKIAEGELEVMFQGDEDILSFCSSRTSFTVVESCAYFEASQHILRSLQTAEVDTMPFRKYLISGDCESVDQPEYLKKSIGYNLSFLLAEEEKNSLSDPVTPHDDFGVQSFLTRYSQEKLLNECFVVHNVANLKNWPTYDRTELDKSQLTALHMALTQEIAVIQGPPGTGKTYIGLKIVEALLNNKSIWNTGGTKSPILVMCFTNHALDQFLEGILECPLYKDKAGAEESLKLVRIGGRCKSEKVSRFNLRNMKHEVYLPSDVLRRKFFAQDMVKEFESSISYYAAIKGNNKLLPLGVLQECFAILPEHHSALFHPLATEPQCSCALEIWLGLVDTNDPRFNAWTDTLMDPTILAEQGIDIASKADEKSEDKTVDQHESQDKQQGEENHEDDDKSLIDITGEATVEQAGRLLDDEEHRVVKEVKFTSHSSDYSRFMKDLSNMVSHVATYEEFYEDGESATFMDPSIYFNQTKAEKNLRSIFSVEPMSKSEYQRVRSILALPIRDRHRLYQFWRKQCLKHLRQKCEEEFREYNRLCREQNEAKKEADRFAFETAEIIGMTTTGAAKYQHILHLVKPRIVIVEEAAEVLESHIVSALNAGTQHLILIGDHKQLRPKPNEYELAKKYHLDVSLFERLIRNGFPHSSLEYQHRMRPEIAQLVKPHIYSTLFNHLSVEQYPDIRGVSTNLFFISHHFEEREDENLVSHSNPHEAAYLVNLCKYLLQQCYEPHQITILVTYSGQLLAIRKLMPRVVFEGVRVSTVDNFQGEENDIILLSLVRSNSDNNVGFLREENRVCVALSRARMGFYCIGNFTMLRDVPIWNTIMSDMEEKGKLGYSLLLHCSNHPEINFMAKCPQDFAQKSPKGGCLKDCIFRLLCGHVCTQKCHYTDPNHDEFRCVKDCTKSCKEGHPCRNRCYQPCQCMVRVTRPMPGCDHDQKMYCYEDPVSLECIGPCKKLCPKGHSCPLKCHETCRPCVVEVSISMPKCHHNQWIKCSQDRFEIRCRADCSRECENGHPCPLLCSEPCGSCTIPVTKTIPECKHQIDLPCHVRPKQEDCTKQCERVLPCSHKCRLRCGEVCSSVDCEVKVTVQLPECGHQIVVHCFESHDITTISCTQKCSKSLPCGHDCGLKCSEPCKTKCEVKVNKVWPCGHKLKRPCYQIATPEEYPCNSKCERVLECGHPCPKHCGEPCEEKCQKQVSKLYPCGHKMTVPCSSTPSQVPCKMLCPYILACGHKCSGKCSECSTKRIHQLCSDKLGMKRFCGHSIHMPCSGLTDSHSGSRKDIAISCHHATVIMECSSEHFHTCDEPCGWSCIHHECDKLCSESCDRLPCEERCTKKLSCGHQCHGLCGEPCLSLCPQCRLRNFNKKLKSPGHFDAGYAYYELPCNHIFTVEYLDSLVQTATNSKANALVVPLQCPVKECSRPFSCSYRYGNHMKRLLSYVQDINYILQSSTSANSSVGVDEETLQKRIEEISESDSMEMEDLGDRVSRRQKVPIQYKPMHEITYTICKLRQLKPRQTEDKYIFSFLFIEALGYLEALTAARKYTDTPGYEDTLKAVKRFLRFLSSQIRSHQFKMTYQLIIDVQKELLRLSLCTQITLAKCGEDTMHGSLVKAEAYLESISTTISKIAKSEFRRHMDVISTFIPLDLKSTLNYRRSAEEMDEFHPAIRKGEWWRCNEGHYYCSPLSLLEDVVRHCPHCKLGKSE